MDNEKVSAILSGQREKLGLSVEDVSRQTLIRRTYIEAIDRGDYGVIPDPVYTKGFIRNYAKAVGLLPDAVVRQWVREEEGGWERPKISKNIPVHEMPRKAEVALRASGRRPFNQVEWAIIIVVIALLVFFWLWLLYM